MPTVSRGEADIWYRDDGDGLPVLLLHGGLFDSMDGERFWWDAGVGPDIVARGYRVLTPDRRYGGGRTSAPFAVHDWDVEVADVTAVLNHAGVARATVIAGSNGCSAALRFALVAPLRVAGLVLCWPVAPDNDLLRQAFARSAGYMSRNGPTAYFERLREDGVPVPGEQRAGFAFGLALLKDERAARTFLACRRQEAAGIVGATADGLFTGDLLRGIDAAAVDHLESRNVWIVPPRPASAHHRYETAKALSEALPAATLTAPFPLAPSADFAESRAAFGEMLADLLAQVR